MYVAMYLQYFRTLFRPGIEMVCAVSSRFVVWDKRQVRFDQNNNIFISHVPRVERNSDAEDQSTGER